jgi:hypothetical protein
MPFSILPSANHVRLAVTEYLLGVRLELDQSAAIIDAHFSDAPLTNRVDRLLKAGFSYEQVFGSSAASKFGVDPTGHFLGIIRSGIIGDQDFESEFDAAAQAFADEGRAATRAVK